MNSLTRNLRRISKRLSCSLIMGALLSAGATVTPSFGVGAHAKDFGAHCARVGDDDALTPLPRNDLCMGVRRKRSASHGSDDDGRRARFHCGELEAARPIGDRHIIRTWGDNVTMRQAIAGILLIALLASPSSAAMACSCGRKATAQSILDSSSVVFTGDRAWLFYHLIQSHGVLQRRALRRGPAHFSSLQRAVGLWRRLLARRNLHPGRQPHRRRAGSRHIGVPDMDVQSRRRSARKIDQ